MRIAWFVPFARKLPLRERYDYNNVSASTWIRCLQLIPYFKALGVQCRVNTGGEDAQVAVFLRRWGKKEQDLARRLKAGGVKIILDTPVNYFSSQNLPAFEGGVRDDFLSFAEIADAIFCPSPYTEQYGRKLGYNIFCMEESVNFEHFRYRKEDCPERGKQALVWCGVSVKADVLNFLSQPIMRNNWPVVIISDKKPGLNFDFKFIKWKYETLPFNIVKGDIGIFPRSIDNEYDLGHAFFKIGIFLAEHVPVICTPLPSYNQVITENNAVCIRGLDEKLWEENIRAVICKEKVFDFSRNPVRHFSTQDVTQKYYRFFLKILQEQPQICARRN